MITIKNMLLALIAILAVSHINVFASEERARAAFTKLVGDDIAKGMKVQRLSDGEGIYRIALKDGRTAEMAIVEDKVMIGEVFDEETMVSLQNILLQETLEKFVGDLDDGDLIEFAPAGNIKTTVTVFTDLDCGFCRSLHQSMKAFNDAGIKVQYAPYPRAGIGSKSMEKMETVYCSKDRQDALTKAKAGEELAPISCTNNVQKIFLAASEIGVSFTPVVYTQDGRMIPGFAGEQQLIDQIFSK